MYCDNGYVFDANGCQTCECIKDPVICPEILCSPECSYQKYYDNRGCPTCVCNPCPKLDCGRTCVYGYQEDVKTGCQVCLCNEKPIDCYLYVKSDANANGTTTTNTATTTATASLTFQEVCALDCVNGYYKDDRGCDICYCLKPEDVCNCVKPADFVPTKCRDGSVTYLTDKCDVNSKEGYCLESRCRLYLAIYVNSSLTTDELQKLYDGILRYSGTVAESDVTIDKEILANGTVVYTVTIQRDALPTDEASGEPIAERLAKDEAVASKGGVTYVLSDSVSTTSPNTGFASLLVVPFLGVLISLLS
jgi:hypothetical protein